jgi:CubicO group peptidase (beta-lactamase class C family)
MNKLQEQIQRHIDTLAGTGAETGVQVAAYQDGALIVDAVAGTADRASGRPVTSGTPIFSFSTGKNVAATLAHLLVARGFLDYDSPVTDLWPEFGVHGKSTATDPARGVVFALTKTRLVRNFDTALSVTTILAGFLAGIR